MRKKKDGYESLWLRNKMASKMQNTTSVIYWKSLHLLQASQEAVHSAESFYFFKYIKIELTLIYTAS